MKNLLNKIILFFRFLFKKSKEVEVIIKTPYSFPRNPRHYLNGLVSKSRLKS